MKITRIDTEHFSAKAENGAYTVTGLTHSAKCLMRGRGLRGPRRRLFMGSLQLFDTLQSLNQMAQVVEEVLA